MSKILICPDIHYCINSSLIKSKGVKYSRRIENCIQSINWVENQAIENNCEAVFYLGDFFDKNILEAEIITSLNDLNFNNLQHYCLVGNHEISLTDNQYSSMHILNTFNNFKVVNQNADIVIDNVKIHMLPYAYDCEENLLNIINFDSNYKNIVLSHNDLKDVQYGLYKSTKGLSLDSIMKNCDLFINGHIHNSSWVTSKIINLGILTGKDLNEDANLYKHQILILDLDSLQTELIENPYAFNFYKLEIQKEADLKKLNSLKNNAVVSIKCTEQLFLKCKEIVNNLISLNKMVAHKITISKDTIENDNQTLVESLSIDPIQKLREFCLCNIDNTDTLLFELDELCK